MNARTTAENVKAENSELRWVKMQSGFDKIKLKKGLARVKK